ncbi:MAG: acetate--CoA ligase [Crenarchaeota archaeon]|nr:acetate--CoA ligase [Thermoproteota archaeon]
MSETALPFHEKIIPPSWKDRTVDIEEYKKLREESLKNIEEFWAKIAEELPWFKKWEKVLDASNPPFYKWFVGAETNMSYLCLDWQLQQGRKNKVALIWEGEPVNEKGEPIEVRKLTYYDLWRETNRIAYMLKNKLGVRKGEIITFYCPMIPELAAFLLATVRIGAAHSVVFSGFSSQALAERIKDAESRIVVTADGMYRRGKILRLKDVVDEAVKQCPTVEKVIVIRRVGLDDINVVKGRDLFFDELMEDVPKNVYVEPERMKSEDMLFILYTSGTTGKPKGIVHDIGGYAVGLYATMKWIFDVRDDDIFFNTADIGWITGHSYNLYGPLLTGLTFIWYEGAPDYPAPDRWWSIIERYGVTIFYTSPTAIRMFMRYGEDWVKKHDLSTLRIAHTVGEPINPEAWRWYFKHLCNENCAASSTWWMTETGIIMISHTPGLKLIPLKPGTNAMPIPGVDADVVNEKGESCPPGVKGYLVIKTPWPGMLLTIYKDPERYIKTYWSKFPVLLYYSGDFAVKDQDGYIWVLGRADEVLKVAGHRIGTAEIESALVQHPAVAEAAVVGKPDPVKGEVPVAFVVLRQGYNPSPELVKELKMWVRKSIGPVAEPAEIYFVTKLPKTRSGKIMRRLIKAVLLAQPLGDVSTLEDEASVEEVKRAYEEFKKLLEGQ